MLIWTRTVVDSRRAGRLTPRASFTRQQSGLLDEEPKYN
ncbi:hypothetical protein ANO14919_010500 [Xylariales sp. No.14919]|nr:hypothetical protein ANO14919_010500 [Xylariales sp. No.14919]